MRGTAETPDLILSGEIGVNKTVNTESLNIYENGDYTPPAGVDGYDDIHVDVRPVIDSITIRENGTYEASGEVDGYSPVVVNVPQSAAKVYAKNINANGNYYPDAGYDGFSQVSVNVPATPLRPLNVTENGEYNPPTGEGYSNVSVDVPTEAEIESITITENGTYIAPTGVDGYSPVIVNVPQPEDAYYIKDMTPGAIASFNDGADMVLPSLTASIVPVQAGSGEPSPTNVRPITGWTEEVITRTGKNLWGGEKLADDIVAKVPQATKDTTNKTVTYFASQVTGKTFFDKFKANTQYTIYLSTASTYTNANILYSDGTYDAIDPNTYKVTYANKTVSEIRGAWASGTTILNYEECGVFEGVITAQDFVAYNGTTTTIPFTDGQGQSVEVFGGSVDVVNGGEQQRTIKVFEVDEASDIEMLVPQIFRINKSKYPDGKFTGDSIEGLLCEKFKPQISDMPNNICYSTANGLIIRTIDEYANTSEFFNTIGSFKFTYELATPTTFYTQPTSIKSLEGENNVGASTGDVLSGSYFSETPA